MSDIVIEVALDTPDDEIRLFDALDTFALWRDSTGQFSDEAPDLMVRTSFDPAGALSKQVIFQDRKWAKVFQRFWNGKTQAQSEHGA